MSVAPVAWSMAPTGAADGLGAPLGALDGGGAEALGEGDAPLELQATTREGEDREEGVAGQCWHGARTRASARTGSLDAWIERGKGLDAARIFTPKSSGPPCPGRPSACPPVTRPAPAPTHRASRLAVG